jgi:ribonuclease-3
MKHASDMGKLERTLGHTFRDRTLLALALVHSSAREPDGEDNQTLEFLGDAVLGLAVSDLATTAHPDLDEGALTRLRASVVNAISLATLARDLSLGSWLRLGRGEELSGGRDKDRILAACYEAIVGAVFRDAGYTAAQAMIARHFGTAVEARAPVSDFKTTLQELVQASGKGTPSYRLVEEEGPAHERRFVAEVVLRGRALGSGAGANRKEAEQAAARRALESLDAGDLQSDEHHEDDEGEGEAP